MTKQIEQLRRKLIREWAQKKPKMTPLVVLSIEGKEVVIKDESKNETETYKDKHGWMMGLDYLKNHFPNPFIYYLGSTGNAGLSDFAFADKLNEMIGEQKVLIVNFYPLHYDDKILGPDSKGRFTDGKRFREVLERFKSGKVIQVDFSKVYWFDDFEKGFTPCLNKMNELELGKSIGLEQITRKNSLDITEGFKPTYTQIFREITEHLKTKYGKIPKTLAIIQFGAGMLYDDSKAFAIEKKLPIDFMAVSTGDKHTIADKICDSSESWQKSLKDLRTKGFTIALTSGSRIYNLQEGEILSALKVMRKLDLESEASGAAGLAMVLSPRLKDILTKDKNFAKLEEYEVILVINTGNGLRKCA